MIATRVKAGYSSFLPTVLFHLELGYYVGNSREFLSRLSGALSRIYVLIGLRKV